MSNEYKIIDYEILGVERWLNKNRIEVHIRCIKSHLDKGLNSRVFLNFEFDEFEDLYFFRFHSIYNLDLINFLINSNILIIKNEKYYLNKHILLKLI